MAYTAYVPVTARYVSRRICDNLFFASRLLLNLMFTASCKIT